ncbi:MAG TPA: bifunctional 3'-5' exonuclease/DNA polymerase, partial [Terrimesophilobacter sp.]|nr:bifunctional 3'-5' exonuclease/DNA polymerase [Terrimesophilobacter sp.]
MLLVLSRIRDAVSITEIGDDGAPTGLVHRVTRPGLAAEVALRERDRPRWVWDDTERWYPRLLDAGVRVERCVDLRLSHSILRHSELSAASELARAGRDEWDELAAPTTDDGLFALETRREPDPIAEVHRQRAATTDARLTLLLAAESAGALVAAEMRHRGLPWRADIHNQLLTETLGPRPAAGDRPQKLAVLAGAVRDALDAPALNPDSPVELLKALRRAGLDVKSTAKWELYDKKHPVIAPLLEYKALARLLSANGWHWLDENVRDGRFRADYVVGGVVTGRWASKGGGGAMQLPKAVRAAVVADPGWKLVVADASQLEPRILAAMSGDAAMAHAGRARDMYDAIVERGAVATRDQAKVAMLGA